MKKLALYRGLVYANLIYSRENSAKLVKEQSQTVYAQIDHAKTARRQRTMNISETRFPSQECFNDKKKRDKKKKKKRKLQETSRPSNYSYWSLITCLSSQIPDKYKYKYP